MTLKKLAEHGWFTTGKHGPLESAARADLYEAFQMLSIENAVQDYKNNYQQEAQKDADRKRKRR